MELTYYSYYPYKDPNKSIFEDEEKGDLWVQPFRLYKAAVCRSLADFPSREAFVQACYEAMDCPEYHVPNYVEGQPYKDEKYNVEVIPTKHFYGATNSDDGVFYFSKFRDNTYIIPMLTDEPEVKANWYEAVAAIFRKHCNSYVSELCDFTMDK